MAKDDDKDLADAVDEATGMVSLKRTKSEKKEADKAMCVPYEGDDYPYGTRIRLDDDSLEKLGIDKLPAVGDKVSIEAVAVVTETSQRDSGREKRRSVELQIQKIALGSSK